MKKIILTIFLCAYFFTATKAQALADIETVRSRFFTDYKSSSHSSSTASRTSMTANGSWSDLDYVNSFPITHLSRLNAMAGSYQTSSHSEYHSPAMLIAITKGLDYWCTNVFSFYYSNWFDFDIGQQDYLQKVLILMQGSISNTLLLKGCSLLSTQRPDPSWVEGQNLVWILGQKLHRGILLKDSADMRSALDSIQMQLDIVKYTGHVQTSTATDGVGIQEDYSFFQHGAQFYNCGYGRSFLEDQIAYGIKVSSTTFAVNPNRLQVLSDLMLNTCKLYRNALFHDYGEGRGIAIEGTTKNYMQPLLSLISTLLPANKPLYDAVDKHIAGTGNKYSFLGNQFFWNGDFMAHQRSAYYASVRMCSNRTVGTESFSGDNRNGFWNPFGLQFITRNGTEYFNIFPLWKWSHVPGVTCPDTIPVFPTQNLNQTETFVGGVSDGNYGMSVMSVNKFSTAAKKTWFYFDNEIVALGAGITCTLTKTVNTTLNQCFLKSNVVADNVTLASGNEYSLTSPKWVLQDSIGYIFPQSSNVKVSNKSITGSWSYIGQGSTTPVTANVFNLWINHGAKPTNATYQYIILPGVNQQGVSAYAAAIPVLVISNTTSIQAVRQTRLNVTQAAFYAKGSISIPNFSIDVDQPCLIMSKFIGDSMIISASNPVQSNLVLNVTVTAANSSKTLTFTFTKGSSCGKTQTKFILLKNGTEVSAYPQILPLNYKSFFAVSAMGTDSLVKVTYATYTLSILPNQWNNIAGSISPGSSTVENSTLSYSNYCDNNLGKAIVSTGDRRYGYYSLTSGAEYTEKTFYMSALINFSAIKTGDAFILFGKDYVGNYARGKLYPTSNGSGYSLGVQSSAETVVYGNTVLNFGTTYLIVLKITPAVSGTEYLSVFVNPTIGGTEPVTPEATTSAAAILTKIQSIGFRATPTGKIAGLRFSDNWADVVKQVSSSITSFIPTTGAAGTIVTITGTNLTGTTAVSFGGTSATLVTVLNPTTITAVVGSGNTGKISITTPDGIINSEGIFTFIPSPTIISFTPTNGAVGTMVSITGTNFTSTTAVNIGGTPAASFTVVNSTTVTAVAGNGITGNISITTLGGTVTSGGLFTITYPQTLPIDYSQFFASTSINTNGTDLVRDVYANQTPTPVPATPILANEWTFQFAATPLVSPIVEASTLSYLNYIDNNLGKAVVFSSATPTRNNAFYPLTSSSTAYTGKPFYLSMLINISSFRSTDPFLMFGSNIFGMYQRGKVQVISNGTGFSLGVQFNTETAVNGTTVLNKNQTYLVISKITPTSSGTETLSVFVNPILGSTEPIMPEVTTSISTAALLYIKGIDLRATFTGKMAGLRFSDNWDDVVKKDTVTDFAEQLVYYSIIVSEKIIITSQVGIIQVYNMLGIKVLESKGVNKLNVNLANGLYIIRFINQNREVTSQKHIFSGN